MENNTIGEIKGVGIVRKKTSNGLIRLLTDVLHVLGLRRNLISFRMLGSKGCSFVAKRGPIKVKWDSCIMFLGKKVGNLYVLLGSRNVGDITKNKRVWKSMGKSIEGIDDESPIVTPRKAARIGKNKFPFLGP